MKLIRIRPLAEHPDAMLLRLMAETPSGRPPRGDRVRVLASQQAVTLEGLIAKSEHALGPWRAIAPADRHGRFEEALVMCLEQAVASLQALPVTPMIRRVGIPFEMRAAARAWKEAGR